MGRDIYCYVEYLVDGKWVQGTGDLNLCRDQTFFYLLNGCFQTNKAREMDLKPLVEEPRGSPENVSEELREEMDRDCLLGLSWLLASELLGDPQFTKVCCEHDRALILDALGERKPEEVRLVFWFD